MKREKIKSNRKQVELGMSTLDAITLMSEGNPGGLTAMLELLKKDPMQGMFDILSLDDMNIRGSQIWVGYKDHCGQNIDKFIQCIHDRDPAMVATINGCAGTGTDERAVQHGGSWHGGRWYGSFHC